MRLNWLTILYLLGPDYSCSIPARAFLSLLTMSGRRAVRTLTQIYSCRTTWAGSHYAPDVITDKRESSGKGQGFIGKTKQKDQKKTRSLGPQKTTLAWRRQGGGTMRCYSRS